MPSRKGKKVKKSVTEDAAATERKERAAQIILVVRDLEVHQERMTEEILNVLKESQNKINNLYSSIKNKIPQEVLNMTMDEINAQHIDLQAYLNPVASEKSASGVANPVSQGEKHDSRDVLAKFLKRKNTIQQKKVSVGPSVKKNSGSVVPSVKKNSTGKKVMSNKRKSQMFKKRPSTFNRKFQRALPSRPLARREGTAGVESDLDDSYSEVSEDEVFFTPSHSDRSSQAKKKFAPITPKFDPRKPVMRSELRRARPGEMAVSLSGSPLLVEATTAPAVDQNFSVTLGKKKFTFSDSQLTKGVQDTKEREAIAFLQKKLALMLKK